MAELTSNAIDVYLLEKKQMHNDSTTSVTFFGQYENEDSKAVKLKHGFNKDHRPDCKQIVFGLNITADGNRTDDTTHIPNWNALREFLGKASSYKIKPSFAVIVNHPAKTRAIGEMKQGKILREVQYMQKIKQGQDLRFREFEP